MTVLIVDDDPNKTAQLATFMRATFPRVEFITERSYQRGLRAALTTQLDVIILDMSMPNYNVGGKEKGGPDRRYGGQLILDWLKRKGIEIPVVIVTQFERFGEGDEEVSLNELDETLRNDHSEIYLGSVYYQAADSQWMSELERLLAPILGSIERENPHVEDSGDG